MNAMLTTQVLDTAHGCPAAGMQIELWAVSEGAEDLLKTVRTNAEGRPPEPLLEGEQMIAATYELVFHVGDYFLHRGGAGNGTPFLDTVPVRFGITEAGVSCHVPLIVSPWAYTDCRGS